MAWGTALKYDFFWKTYIGLAAIYSFALYLVLSATVFLININRVQQFTKSGESFSYNLAFSETLHQILNFPVSSHAVGAVGIIILAFILARWTLQPIRHVMEMQHRFIADAAHELRTPLTNMKTTIEVSLLGVGYTIDKEFKKVLEENLEEVDRMSDIINNLLRLAHADTKAIPIPMQKIDLRGVVKECLKIATRFAEKKQVTFKLSCAEEEKEALVLGYKTGLEEIVLNLIRNAIAYTPPGGEVEICLSSKRVFGVIELSVHDTGVGISQKDLPHIFEPFYRVDASRVRADGAGSGLGLAIVREIVRQHNGQIFVKSALGKGTTMFVQFIVA